MARLGFRTIDEMIGRVDLLRRARRCRSLEGAHARSLARCCITPDVAAPARRDASGASTQDHRIDDVLDRQLIELRAARARAAASRCSVSVPDHERDRAVGAMLSGEIARRYGTAGLPDGHDPIRLHRLGGSELRRVRCARA